MTEQFTRWDSAEYLKTEEDMGQLSNFSRDPFVAAAEPARLRSAAKQS